MKSQFDDEDIDALSCGIGVDVCPIEMERSEFARAYQSIAFGAVIVVTLLILAIT